MAPSVPAALFLRRLAIAKIGPIEISELENTLFGDLSCDHGKVYF